MARRNMTENSKLQNTYDFLPSRLASARLLVRLSSANPGVRRTSIDKESIVRGGTADTNRSGVGHSYL